MTNQRHAPITGSSTNHATNAPDWFRLEHSPAGVLLKSGNRRKVWRVRNPDGSLIAKVFDPPPQPFGFLTALPMFNPAHREAAAIRRAIKRGVPTSPVVHVERDRNTGRSVLAVEELADTRSLVEQWSAADAQHRRILISAAAATLARAHEQGFVHPDLHPENILVRSDGGDRVELWFIDILGAKFFAGSVPFEPAVESLAQLDQSFHRLAQEADRRQFLHDYLQLRGLEPTHGHAWAQAVQAARACHAEKLARQRDRRLRGNNKYFSSFAVGRGWRATVALQLERRHVFAEPEVLDQTIKQWQGALNSLLAGQSSELLVERFRSGGLSDSVAWLVHGSPARRMFEDAHRRRHRDEIAELVLGYAERRNSMGLLDAALVIRPAGRGRIG